MSCCSPTHFPEEGGAFEVCAMDTLPKNILLVLIIIAIARSCDIAVLHHHESVVYAWGF